MIESTDFQTITRIKPGVVLKLPIVTAIHVTSTGFNPLPPVTTTTLGPTALQPVSAILSNAALPKV